VSDKPGHILEIPDSLGRDLDKAAAGKIPAPPIEAFMSDSALEQAEKAARAAAEPVHAEDLKPVSAAEAAARTTFGGEHLPSLPSARRVIPAPFRRERVTGGRHGKTWQPVRADQVVPGDMTELVGKVAAAEPVLRREAVAGVPDVATGTGIVLTGIGGVTETVDAARQVRVFRRS
jgi:hypothetical protein